MNLTKALKQKKKLVKLADTYYERFANNNKQIEGQEVTYDPETNFENWLKTITELVDLKTKIHIANQPIAHKIFMLGELKNQVTKIKRVSTDSGKITERYSERTFVYISWMNTITRDSIVAKLEEQIETLQEEIEAFNAITKI